MKFTVYDFDSNTSSCALISFSVVEKNGQNIQFKVRDDLYALWFQMFHSMVIWFQRGNGMVEGHGETKLLTSWQLEAEHRAPDRKGPLSRDHLQSYASGTHPDIP